MAPLKSFSPDDWRGRTSSSCRLSALSPIGQIGADRHLGFPAFSAICCSATRARSAVPLTSVSPMRAETLEAFAKIVQPIHYGCAPSASRTWAFLQHRPEYAPDPLIRTLTQRSGKALDFFGAFIAHRWFRSCVRLCSAFREGQCRFRHIRQQRSFCGSTRDGSAVRSDVFDRRS